MVEHAAVTCFTFPCFVKAALWWMPVVTILAFLAFTILEEILAWFPIVFARRRLSSEGLRVFPFWLALL